MSRIATNIAGVPFEIMEGTRASSKPIESGDLWKLFNRPNPELSRYQLWESTMIYLSTGGECMWFLIGKGGGPRENDAEVPSEIWPLPGEDFTPIATDKAIEGWKYRSRKGGVVKEITLPIASVIQFKYFNPYNPLRGLPPLAAVMQSARQDFKASKFNEAFFDNGADPGGIISIDTGSRTTAQQVEEFRKQWEERHVGSGKRGRTAIVPFGMKYEQNEVKHRDMEFLEQRKWNRSEILAAFGVPPSEVGEFENMGGLGGESSKRSADRGFWIKTLVPKIRYLEDVLAHRLFMQVENGRQWGRFATETIESLQDDFGNKVKLAETLSRMGYPINQIAERLGLEMERVEWGDEAFGNLSQVPLRTLVDAVLPENEPDKQPKPDADGEDQPDEDADKAIGRKRNAVKWARFVKIVLDPNEKILMRKLSRYFMDMRSDVLGRLRRTAGFGDSRTKDLTPEDVQNIQFAEREWDEKLKKLVRPNYAATAAAAATNLEGELVQGFTTFELNDPALLRFLSAKEIKVTEINDTVRDALRSSLLDGIRKNETVNELQERIRGLFNSVNSDARRLRIARTETAQVANGTREIAMRAEGIRRHRWSTANDENVRESHQEIDGDVVEIGQPFDNGLRYPGDIRGPAGEVVNCRCLAEAVPNSQAG